MGPQVTFGVRLPVAGPLADKAAIDTAARRAVELGYDTLWVHDFIVWTRFLDRAHVSCGSVEAVDVADAPPTFYESVSTLAYLAGLTNGTATRLGFAVLCLPWRHPIIAARQVATIDVLSGGRVTLGVGVGAPKDRNSVDFETLGIPRERRYARTRDYLRAMRSIWSDDIASHDGEFTSFPPTEFFPKPAQSPHPPIWLGGSGPTTLGILGEFGDGWLPGLLSPEDFPPKIAAIHQAAEAAHRSDFDLTVGAEITACIAPTHEEAERTGTATFRSMTEGFPISMEQVLACGLMGSATEVQDQVGRFVAAGVRHFELKFIYHTLAQLLEEIEQFRAEVVPAFA
jgi:alkanesulfonate monooxygenase SsuD/methylene tetrahydromethanopterin reductase-like flavin-dependent oxidoreductase (luciferase family)